jgi:hypothetical protein
MVSNRPGESSNRRTLHFPEDLQLMVSQLNYVATSLAFFLGAGALCVSLSGASGQEPAVPSQAPANSDGANQPAPTYGSVPDYVKPQAHQPQRRRSIVHHYPYPYPGAYNEDETAGFRNPGGVGRHAEYYLPGDRFQVEQDPVRVARFNEGGYPSRSEQLAAQQVGISRYNSIQRHIDNYAMPHYGYGFGMGGFGGFW